MDELLKTLPHTEGDSISAGMRGQILVDVEDLRVWISELIKKEREEDNTVRVKLSDGDLERFKALAGLLNYKSLADLMIGATRILNSDIANGFQSRNELPED